MQKGQTCRDLICYMNTHRKMHNRHDADLPFQQQPAHLKCMLSHPAVLLPGIPQDVHITVRPGIRGKNVMIRNDDDLFWVPNLGAFPKLFLKYAKGARPTDIMRQQFINVGPDVCARLQSGVVRMLG